MILEQVISRVQQNYSKGIPSDDTRLLPRLIYNKLITTRARVLSQESKKRQEISIWNYQTIPCVEMILVTTHNCPCVPPIGCEILRSRYKIPKTISGINKDLIKLVSSIDITNKHRITIEPISIDDVPYLSGNKYTANIYRYFLYDGYLFIVGTSMLKVISIVGLFMDIIEVQKFINYCNDCKDCNTCFDYLKLDFPINEEFLDGVIALCCEELLEYFTKMREDLSNNTRDTLKEESK